MENEVKFNGVMSSLMNIPSIKTIGNEDGIITIDIQQIIKDGKKDTLMNSLMALPGIKVTGNEEGMITIDIQQIVKDGMEGGGNKPLGDKYLTFTAQEDNSSVKMIPSGTPSIPVNLQYSLDSGTTWNEYEINMDINLNNGDSVKFRGENDTFYAESGDYKFSMTGTIAASGDITSITNGEGGDVSLNSYCYSNMFQDCNSLIEAPNLPSTQLAESCYDTMFQGCTGLTQAPNLPATRLANNCYKSMFRGCNSLIITPNLPATQLAGGCYQDMFRGCTSLNNITCLATSVINENNSTTNWLSNVSANGTFTKVSGINWPSGASGIPNGWTVIEI